MNTAPGDVAAAVERVRRTRAFRAEGRVRRVIGLAVESEGPPCAVGDECVLLGGDGRVISRSQVVGFSDSRVISMPVDRPEGLAAGCRVVALGRRPSIGVGEHLLGRVLDADGRPLDGRPLADTGERVPLEGGPPMAMNRERIREPFATGVRSIDAMVTLGRGQRIGIFAGSGVGKSKLMGMIARHARADAAVIALVGERGREVRDFVEGDLDGGLEHAIVFAATSDEPPMRRIRAAQAATAAAEYLRNRGRHVVLMMDSVTRVAMAQREIGLSMGEPPSSKGYPPSVFSLLPRLLERAGALERGASITGLYTVFVEGDDLNEPIADAARSLLDGHLVLGRDLATRGHFPAVDVLHSISRLMPQVTRERHQRLARRLRARIAAYRDAEDLILLGAYREGSNDEVDAAIRSRDRISALLIQEMEEGSSLDATLDALEETVRAGDGADS